MILYKKLLDINKKRPNIYSQNLAPVFNFKKKNKEILVQNQIKALAQENLFILKRFLERTSNINNRKLKEDFEKNQEYKNIICNFPSINFYNSKKTNGPIIESFNFNKEKSKNTTNAFPSIYKLSSFQYSKRTTHLNKLDEQYYKNAKKTKKSSPVIIQEKKNSEIESRSGSGSGSGRSSVSGSGSGSGSGNGDGDDENNSASGDGSDNGSGDGSGSGDISRKGD